MNKFHILIFVFILCSADFKASSQIYFQPKQIVPSSPEVGSMEKFVDYPVSQFTGVPSISVPLYSIDLTGFSLPISASYHSSGVKVDDIPGNVGLGWSLFAGGSISIQVNGLLDEMSGYGSNHIEYNKIKTLNFNATFPSLVAACSSMGADNLLSYYTGQDLDYLRGLHYGINDSEPDVYSYNFGNYSGKFFQDESGDFRTIPYSKMAIQRKFNGSVIKGYELKDENGNTFEFFQMEESQTNTFNICSPDPYSVSQAGYSRSYYLTKVTTAFNETIEFKYSNSGYSVELQRQFSRARYLDPNSTCVAGIGGTGNADIDLYNCMRTTIMNVGSVKLDSIVSSTGVRVIFKYSIQDRLDLANKALDRIEVSSKYDMKIFRSFDFEKDYWCGRLRLKAIREGGKPPYQFEYDNGFMPARLSYSQDHWGYYNAASNVTLLPKDEYNGFTTGANREPNPLVSQVGILKKIVYPTGGWTEYEYEPNNYFVSDVTTDHVKVTGATLSSFPNQTRTVNFTVPANSTRHILSYANTYDGTVLHNDYCYIRIYGPNAFQLQLVGANPYKAVVLPPGNYTIEIENVGSTYQAEVTVHWFNDVIVPPHNEIGGGLRVKQINTSDGLTNKVISKKFEYLIQGTANSSGAFMYKPNYLDINEETRYWNVNSCLTNAGILTCQSRVQSSSSTAPLSYSNGYHVGYREVAEYTKDKYENGYVHSKYIVDNSNSLNAPSSPPYPPQINYDWVNGTLLEQSIYKSTGTQFEILKKIKHYYNYYTFDRNSSQPNTFTTYGMKSMLIEPPRAAGYCAFGCASELLSSIAFGLQRYQLYSSWHYRTKTEEFNYPTPSTVMQSSVEYYYENIAHLKPTRLVTNNSNGERITTQIKYPLDYPSLSNTSDVEVGVNALKQKNIVGAEIEKVIKLSGVDGNNERVVSGVFNVYHSSFPLVKTVKSLELNQAIPAYPLSTVNGGNILYSSLYRDQGYFLISSSGRLVQQWKVNDVPTSFLWGYNDNYPIASVTGVNYSSLQGIGLNSSVLSSPPSDAQLRSELSILRTNFPNALVKTYTYRPLFGISSETDARGITKYFEYDVYGRLGLSRDHIGNILAKYCYNYQGQSESCELGKYSSTRSGTFTKFCTEGGSGTSHVYTVTRTSNLSQEDADQLALGDVAVNGQSYANSIGTCVWSNDLISANFYKNNCTSGQTANAYFVTVPAGSFSSNISKYDANQQAQNYAQQQANAYGTCSGGGNVKLYSSNYSGLTGWVVQLTSTATGQVYSFNVSTTSHSVLGQVPMGNYNMRIYRSSGTSYWAYFEYCYNYASGNEGNFYNVYVGSCTDIIIDY